MLLPAFAGRADSYPTTACSASVVAVTRAGGRSTKKVEPVPSREATEIRPCIRRTSSREMYSPSPLPPTPRTKVCDRTGRVYGFEAHLQGSWYRCCGGTVRKLWDCCAHHSTRINGDAALHGYCYGDRKVFCVTYFQTRVPC